MTSTPLASRMLTLLATNWYSSSGRFVIDRARASVPSPYAGISPSSGRSSLATAMSLRSMTRRRAGPQPRDEHGDEGAEDEARRACCGRVPSKPPWPRGAGRVDELDAGPERRGLDGDVDALAVDHFQGWWTAHRVGLGPFGPSATWFSWSITPARSSVERGLDVRDLRVDARLLLLFERLRDRVREVACPIRVRVGDRDLDDVGVGHGRRGEPDAKVGLGDVAVDLGGTRRRPRRSGRTSARSLVYRVRSVLDAPGRRTIDTPFGSRRPTDAVADTEPDDANVSAAPRKPKTRTMMSDEVAVPEHRRQQGRGVDVLARVNRQTELRNWRARRYVVPAAR